MVIKVNKKKFSWRYAAGYSAIELTLSLALMGTALYFGLNFSDSLLSQVPAQTAAQDAYNYSEGVQRYITTHYTLLHELLTQADGQSNDQILTVSPDILKDEGFIKKSFPEQNNLDQYPCAIIFWKNSQLQSFVYYRSNGNDKKLSMRQLHAGLDHIGAMLGLYHDGSVIGAAKDWRLDNVFTKDKFVYSGEANPSDRYNCKGRQIANNSYVVNVTSELALNNQLPKDYSVHQYTDQLSDANDAKEINSHNKMTSDLIMDYNPNPELRKKSNIIFQMNPECQMDPSNGHAETMKDYGSDTQNNHNTAGCKNRQLGLEAGSDPNGVTLTVTGFKSAANIDEQRKTDTSITPVYVGAIKANSIQPTKEVNIGTACSISELGKMARQNTSQNTVNNLYVSQVQCMKNPLCPIDTGGVCYMSINTVTIKILGPPVQSDQIQLPPLTCPVGTFVVDSEISDPYASRPNPYSEWFGGLSCNIENCKDDKPSGNSICSYAELVLPLSGYANQQNIQLYQGVIMAPSIWYQGCPDGIAFGHRGYISTKTYATLKSVTCSNDIGRLAMPVAAQQ